MATDQNWVRISSFSTFSVLKLMSWQVPEADTKAKARKQLKKQTKTLLWRLRTVIIFLILDISTWENNKKSPGNIFNIITLILIIYLPYACSTLPSGDILVTSKDIFEKWWSGPPLNQPVFLPATPPAYNNSMKQIKLNDRAYLNCWWAAQSVGRWGKEGGRPGGYLPTCRKTHDPQLQRLRGWLASIGRRRKVGKWRWGPVRRQEGSDNLGVRQHIGRSRIWRWKNLLHEPRFVNHKPGFSQT